jgi:hypothetical protein
MGIHLKTGRWFDDQDRAAKPSVLLINESFARRYFPNEKPLGKRISGMEIIGVVGDVRLSVTSKPQPELYFSYLESGGQFMHLAVRTRGDPLKLAPVVRGQIQSVDRSQPFFKLMTMEQRLADSMVPRRVTMLLASALGVLALGLAGIGVYGVLSWACWRHIA